MVFVLALETPNGAIATFTSPIPWSVPQNVTPTVNGRTRTVDFVLLGINQVMFAVPPRIDDVVGFLVTTG